MPSPKAMKRLCMRAQARAVVKWAEVAELQAELERQVEAVLGPKTAADLEKPDKKKKKKVRGPRG